MADYVVYFSNAGVPATGLTLGWTTLVKVGDNSPYLPQPTFSELTGGWYKYSFTPTESLVGVIDGGVSLPAADRRKSQFIPVGTPIVPGSIAVTFNTTDALSSLPIPDVEAILLNQDESLFVNAGLTNSMGNIQYQLNPGIYKLRLRKDGWNFTVPITVTVTSGPVTFSYQGTNVGDIQADFRTVVVPKDTQF